MKGWFTILAAGSLAAGCASTAEGPKRAPTKLSLESTAEDVYASCVRIEGSVRGAHFDCGSFVLALRVGDEGDDFLESRVASAVAAAGAGPVRAAPFLLPVGGESSTVLRTAVYADTDESIEAMVHLGVFVASERLALSCTATRGLPESGDVCARVIDQVALSPPKELDLAPPPAEDAVEAKIGGASVKLPQACEVAAGSGETQIRCPDAEATVRFWSTYAEADDAAREPGVTLRAYGARVDLRLLSCEILGSKGECHIGTVQAAEDEMGLVVGTAQLEGGTWASLECSAPSGISHPLCRALAVAK
jgi:hypothetical protein